MGAGPSPGEPDEHPSTTATIAARGPFDTHPEWTTPRGAAQDRSGLHDRHSGNAANLHYTVSGPGDDDESETMSTVKFTIDHDEIREWAEQRGGVPATIRGSASDDGPGILCIALPIASVRTNLLALTWEEFFAALESNELACMIDDKRCRVVMREDGRRVRGPLRPRRRIGAITLLERQHREIEAMFRRVHELEDDVVGKAALFARIADAIAAHAKVEETIFYPAVLGLEAELESQEAEHLAVKQRLSDMLGLDPADPRFDVELRALEQLVERHAEEEEDDLFAMIEGLDRDARLELGARMQRVYDQLLQTEPRLEVPDDVDYAVSLA